MAPTPSTADDRRMTDEDDRAITDGPTPEPAAAEPAAGEPTPGPEAAAGPVATDPADGPTPEPVAELAAAPTADATDPEAIPARRIGTPAALFLAAVVVTIAVVAGLVLTGRLPGPGTCPLISAQACTRVLFLGNSYTDVNDLPHVFAELAASGGQHVGTGKLAPGGVGLADHVKMPDSQAALASTRWNVVVLQEQSQVPSVPSIRAQQMDPAARTLVASVRAGGARPLFLETWGHRDGWPDYAMPDFDTMQTRIEQGYLEIAHELDVAVAPAGEAWRSARLHAPQVDLWQPDGSHPTVAGTYLAACVLYASIFGRSPVGLSFTADLPAATAQALQTAAAHTVLDDQVHWTHP